MRTGLCAFRFGLLLLMVLAASFAVSHEAHHKTKKPVEIEIEKLKKINADYIQSVKPLFQKACLDCHSANSNSPWYGSIPGAKQLIQSDITEARKHLDMTQDFPFQGHASPKEDLESISKTIADKTMPPLRYRIMHPSAAFGDRDRRTIQDWIEKSLAELARP